MLKKYLLLANGIGKEVEFDTNNTWEAYAQLQRDYADDVNDKPHNVDMIPLYEEQKFEGLYWDEKLTNKGVIFNVIITADVPNDVTKRLDAYLNANRDVLAINYKYYTPYEG